MSTKKKRVYNRKRQNFNGLKIIHSENVFDGKTPKKGIKVVGRINRDMPFVTKFNPKTLNESYLTDYSKLPLNLKSKVIKDFFQNPKRKVLYLVDK